MAEQEQEQNRSEDPTPYKLRKAREKGMVARGTDLGFFATLAVLAGLTIAAGDTVANQFAMLMRKTLAIGIQGAREPQGAAALAGSAYWEALRPVAMFGIATMLAVALLEIVQLRGFIFSTHPLKPDFSRINPAKGLKRLFSMRLLKESLKNVIKLAAYATVAWLVIRAAVEVPARSSIDAQGLAGAMQSSGLRLLLYFLLVALFFVALDQLIARREHMKQMRMSRRELTREHKEREGEPRMKAKRKQVHAEFAKNAKGMGSLPGSDLLIVNPTHYAVALRYDAGRMEAPKVTAKGRNHWALMLKAEAFRLGIPLFEMPPLARALHDQCETGGAIRESHFRDVADLYLKLQRSSARQSHVPDTAQQ
jgi:flagellar biosynthetic protein FlhB